jgi:hypothetical protein
MAANRMATKTKASKNETKEASAVDVPLMEEYEIGDMVVVKYRIVGVTPLLQKNGASMPAEAPAADGLQKHDRPLLSGAEQAAAGAYRMEDGRFWHPAEAFRSAAIDAVVGTKIKIGRRNAGAPDVFGSGLFTLHDQAFLIHPETGKPLTEYVVDTRSVVNPSTGGRILCSRPRWDQWAVEVEFEYNPLTLNVRLITQGLNLAGALVGVGELRPMPKRKNPKRGKGGRFGKFKAEVME